MSKEKQDSLYFMIVLIVWPWFLMWLRQWGLEIWP